MNEAPQYDFMMNKSSAPRQKHVVVESLFVIKTLATERLSARWIRRRRATIVTLHSRVDAIWAIIHVGTSERDKIELWGWSYLSTLSAKHTYAIQLWKIECQILLTHFPELTEIYGSSHSKQEIYCVCVSWGVRKVLRLRGWMERL